MGLIIYPIDSLCHEKVHISVNDLLPFSLYKVELQLLHEVGVYRSFGIFKSNSIGNIDLSRDAPIRGTYAGVREMGLFESVEPTDSVRFGGYCKCTPPDDFKYLLRVMNSKNDVIFSRTLTKRLRHPSVERIEVETYVENARNNSLKITGTIFKPTGDGPFPTIVDVSGTGGGINEQKGAALASRGFCAFSLAFFQYKSLPISLNEVDLQYFEEAIEYLISLSFTQDTVGIQGVSFGATLVLYLATKIPQYISAVVSINCSNCFDDTTYIKEYGQKVEHGVLEKDARSLEFRNEMLVFNRMLENMSLTDEAIFDYTKSRPSCAFRFVAALDDLSTPTISATNFHVSKLKKSGRHVNVHFLPGGHLLDPPCYPSHPIVYSKFADTYQAYGGETSSHGKSEFDAWKGTIDFFSKFLGKPTPLPRYFVESRL